MLEKLNLEMNAMKQNYSVLYSMDNGFQVIMVLSTTENTCHVVADNMKSKLEQMGITQYHVASFRERLDSNMWIMQMNIAEKFKLFHVEGTVASQVAPEYQVKYFISQWNGKEDELINFSQNRIFVQTIYEQMVYNAEINKHEDDSTVHLKFMVGLINEEGHMMNSQVFNRYFYQPEKV